MKTTIFPRRKLKEYNPRKGASRGKKTQGQEDQGGCASVALSEGHQGSMEKAEGEGRKMQSRQGKLTCTCIWEKKRKSLFVHMIFQVLRHRID